MYLIDVERQNRVLAAGRKHEEEIIKIQAFARGCRDRAKYGRVGKKKNAKRKRASDNKGLSELE